METCNDCGVQYEPWTERSYCRPCKSKRSYQYVKYKTNHPIGWAIRLRNKAQSRAKAKNLEFDLTREFILGKLEKGVCEVTGVPLDLSGGGRKPLTPSLDKIDPMKGYTQDNVQLVSFIYNVAKGDWKHEDVLDFARSLQNGN